MVAGSAVVFLLPHPRVPGQKVQTAFKRNADPGRIMDMTLGRYHARKNHDGDDKNEPHEGPRIWNLIAAHYIRMKALKDPIRLVGLEPTTHPV
ncbi:MAG TPA: hypothetical protein VN541_17100 [Tepidisphaeraceae bacterium]|nr:hypothetical protein [Tepidisphaeraceae bacterium]